MLWVKQKRPRKGVFVDNLVELDAGHFGSSRTLGALSYLEGNIIANVELVESDTRKLILVEKEVLLLSLARDESESFVRERFDCSVHSMFKK